MKARFFRLVVVLSVVVALTASAAGTTFALRIRAEIPFDFQVGGKRLPKGEYLIEQATETGVVTIRHAKKGKAVVFNVIPGKTPDKPKSKLIFHRYGEQYFLARIWDGSSDIVLKLNKSSAEKKAAKLAKKEDKPDEVPVNDK